MISMVIMTVSKKSILREVGVSMGCGRFYVITWWCSCKKRNQNWNLNNKKPTYYFKFVISIHAIRLLSDI